MSLLKLLISLLSLTTLGVNSQVTSPTIDTRPTIEINVQKPEAPKATTAPAIATASDVTEIAKCLTDKGVKFYGAFWCPHCNDQKKQFGDAIQYIDYVECDARGDNANPEACLNADIISYPTWIFPDGARLVGSRPPEELAEKAGCL